MYFNACKIPRAIFHFNDLFETLMWHDSTLNRRGKKSNDRANQPGGTPGDAPGKPTNAPGSTFPPHPAISPLPACRSLILEAPCDYPDLPMMNPIYQQIPPVIKIMAAIPWKVQSIARTYSDVFYESIVAVLTVVPCVEYSCGQRPCKCRGPVSLALWQLKHKIWKPSG